MEILEVQIICREIFLVWNKIKTKLWNFGIVDIKRRTLKRKNHTLQIIYNIKGSHRNSKTHPYTKRTKSILNQNDYVVVEEKIFLQNL